MFRKLSVPLISLLLVLGLVSPGWAGIEFKIGDDTRATFGFKTQIWAQRADDAAPDKSDPATDFSIRAFRLYTSGQITSLVKFGANVDWSKGDWDGSTGRSATATVRDASLTIDPLPEAKIMAGLYRTPFSRTALQDSYQFVLPHSPDIAGAGYLGDTGDFRNAGLTLWGNVLGGKLNYAAGLFDGNFNPIGATTSSDDPFFSARVTVSPLDPEAGYTNAGTYVGKKKILTVGAGYLGAKYGTASAEPAYSAWTVDAFTEIPLPAGALTAEGAWFSYDRDVAQGKTDGYYATLAYLFPVIPLQAAFRYESSDREGEVIGGEDFTKWSVGLAYYIKAHDAKINLEYAGKDFENEGSTPRADRDFSDLTLALQIQF